MSSNREHIARMNETLDRLEADFDERTEEIGDRVRGTEILIRILAGIMGLLALANLYFVNDLTGEVSEMVQSMNQMIGHFDKVSQRMSSMTETVDDMNTTVGMVPVVAAQMNEIAGHMDEMSGSVERMKSVTQTVEKRIERLNRDVTDMAGRYRQVNQSIGVMGRGVDQMARPVP